MSDRIDLSEHPAPPAVETPAPGIRHRRRPNDILLARLGRAASHAWPALAAYALVRIIGVAALALRAGDDGPSLGKLLASRFDTVYYVHIAQYGYAAPLAEGCVVQGPMCKYAFFPLYPGIVRAVSEVLPLPVATVAWGVSLLGALLAAWGIYAVVERVAGRRTAIVAVVLWGIAPHAVVESMAYTEPVFTALCAWALYAAVGRRWVYAGVLASLAGLTRPSGAAVVAAVVLTALWTLVASRRGREGGAERPERTGSLLATILIAPLGWFAWFAWVGYRAGDWRGYFQVQDKWGSTFDGGVFTLHRIADVFLKAPLSLNTVVGAATVITAVVLFVICVQQRLHPALLVYAAVLLLIAVGGAGYFHSKARFLLPAFPLLIPAARALAAARPAVMYTIVVTGTLVSSAYGTYLMMVWRRSP